jgi:phosphopantothenoylcysteine decarboxylase/phosphopantothenate--cysteine ligase
MVGAGADVHVVMTESATAFITPLTLQTISRNPVSVRMFDPPGTWEVRHVSLADRADLVVVVPATANIIGKVSAGIADDLLSTAIMAAKAPVLFVPAMNVHMWENPILQNNIDRLRSFGYTFMEPAAGRLACGYEGRGRLPETESILELICGLFNEKKDFAGTTFLITAGPTREPIDPVRFITNRSTGKMGYGLAEAAVQRGAEVILVSGPVSIPVPGGVTLFSVETAAEMFDVVFENSHKADVIIKAAAVADYRPKHYSSSKIKKGTGDLSLEFERTTDILKYLGENKGEQVLIGFAAETDDLLKNAAAKMQKKNLDLVVANDITVPGAGFGTDTNIIKLIYRDGRIEEPERLPKRELAHLILDRIAGLTDFSIRR